jgi:hypothetical protein
VSLSTRCSTPYGSLHLFSGEISLLDLSKFLTTINETCFTQESSSGDIMDTRDLTLRLKSRRMAIQHLFLVALSELCLLSTADATSSFGDYTLGHSGAVKRSAMSLAILMQWDQEAESFVGSYGVRFRFRLESRPPWTCQRAIFKRGRGLLLRV